MPVGGKLDRFHFVHGHIHYGEILTTGLTFNKGRMRMRQPRRQAGYRYIRLGTGSRVTQVAPSRVQAAYIPASLGAVIVLVYACPGPETNLKPRLRIITQPANPRILLNPGHFGASHIGVSEENPGGPVCLPEYDGTQLRCRRAVSVGSDCS